MEQPKVVDHHKASISYSYIMSLLTPITEINTPSKSVE